MKLMLGTVQFGSSYGTFNTTGQVSLGEASRMLDHAARAGIGMLDTARAYGEAEAVLSLAGAPVRFDIVTKCPNLSGETDPVVALNVAFEESCMALGVQALYGYLLHNAADLARPGVWDALLRLQDEGRVGRIGVSGYDPLEISAICEHFPLTLVQLPANVLDPWYDRIALPDTVELHVRSAFLQGFLLSDPAALPLHLAPFRSVLEQFYAEAAEAGLSPIQGALAPLIASPAIKRVAVGADNLAQLQEILGSVKTLEGLPAPRFGPFANATQNLTDPRCWTN
jgi:L-glyceraldehyde 3-phosphate reductase